MSTNTKIEWTEATWNPVVGCTKVSPGCQNCYAERMANRLSFMGQDNYRKVTNYDILHGGRWSGEVVCDEDALSIPFHWRKPRHIFVCSMGDLFHDKVPFEFIDKVFGVMALCPQHTFQILTKRPERMAEYFNSLVGDPPINGAEEIIAHFLWVSETQLHYTFDEEGKYDWPLPNLWLGVTVENQDYINRVKVLLQIPAAKHFVSFEPLLSHIDFQPEWERFDWAIIGCETGQRRRSCDLQWVQDLVFQCEQAGVPVFVKKLSIDGAKPTADMSLWPEWARRREMPADL